MHSDKYDPYSSLNQRIIDTVIAGTAFWMAYELRFEGRIPVAFEYQLWVCLPWVVLLQIIVNNLLGTYQMIWRYTSLADVVVLARNYALFFLGLILFAYGAQWGNPLLQVPPALISIAFMLSLSGGLSARALRRVWYEGVSSKPRDGAKALPVLLIGAGHAGAIVAKEIRSRLDMRALGFLDDDPKKAGTVISGIRVVGDLNSLPTLLQKHRVQEAIICIPRLPREALKRIWAVCDPLAVRVKIVPTLEEILHGQKSIAAFREIRIDDLLGRAPVLVTVEDCAVAEPYRDRCVMVTGAGGSIGSELACQLAQFQPKQLVLLDKDENGLHETYLRLQGKNDCLVAPVVADIRFAERMRAVFTAFQPEVIFHAAAHKHVHLMEANPCEAIANNVLGTRNLVEQAVCSRVARFVQISTDKAVRPTSIMGASKRVCEMIVQSQKHQHHTRFCCVRFGNVLGSRGSVLPIFQEQIRHGGPVIVTHPEAQRFLMTIPEAVSLLIQAGTLASAGEIFLLDMGKPVLIGNLARDLIELSGLRPGKDVEIQTTQLRPGEKLAEELLDNNTERLLPTQFPKIRMISGRTFETNMFWKQVCDLEQAARQERADEIYRILGEMNIGFCGHAVQALPRVSVPLHAPRVAAAGV